MKITLNGIDLKGTIKRVDIVYSKPKPKGKIILNPPISELNIIYEDERLTEFLLENFQQERRRKDETEVK